ncbi:hypothetical protein [Acetivibrio thermocellus]|uniref:hypothetical protein n=2 Tax=Acetivibrio thermocellus TaxID=1515 RepID=UPI0005A0D8C3|nr:hypothetical protein [Acetivibrio thermocellus]
MSLLNTMMKTLEHTLILEGRILLPVSSIRKVWKMLQVKNEMHGLKIILILAFNWKAGCPKWIRRILSENISGQWMNMTRK